MTGFLIVLAGSNSRVPCIFGTDVEDALSIGLKHPIRQAFPMGAEKRRLDNVEIKSKCRITTRN